MYAKLLPVSITALPRDVAVSPVNVPAGFPSPAADDREETVDPIAWVVRHESATFWWRVSGHSLHEEGIRDGDLVAIDRAGEHRVGRIVLAVVQGEVTIKKLVKREGRLWLAPSSKVENYPELPVDDTTEIWGVLAGVVRRYPVD